MSEVVVQARGLVHAWSGTRALDGVDVTLRRGSITGFLGKNGAGKSTTMRILAGVVVPDGGVATVCGAPAHTAAARARVGWSPEEPPVAPGFTVREQLAFAARLRGHAAGVVDDAIDALDLRSVEHRLCGVLSKGTRQRVGTAMALLGRPDVLLLDEPTAGLDPAQVAGLRALLLRLRDDGAAILLSSHVTAEIEAVADDVIVVAAGRTVHHGSRETLAAAVRALGGPGSPSSQPGPSSQEPLP